MEQDRWERLRGDLKVQDEPEHCVVECVRPGLPGDDAEPLEPWSHDSRYPAAVGPDWRHRRYEDLAGDATGQRLSKEAGNWISGPAGQ